MIKYDINRLNKSKLSNESKEEILNNTIVNRNYQFDFFSAKTALRNVMQFQFATDEAIDVDSLDKFHKFLYNDTLKFTDYLVIGTVCEDEEGGIMVIQESTGEIYELDHDVSEVVLAHFLNSSFSKLAKSVSLHQKYFLLMNDVKKEGKKYVIDKDKKLTKEQIDSTFVELINKLTEIDKEIFNTDRKKIINGYQSRLAWETILFFTKRAIYRTYDISSDE